MIDHIYIGVVYASDSKEIRAVINPSYDWELDDPAHITCVDEQRQMLKLPRGNLPTTMSAASIPAIVRVASEILNRK